jgi:hypothetical protein
MKITEPGGVYMYTLTVFTANGTIEAEPVLVMPGQVAQPRVTMDSETGRVGTALIDVFTPAEPGE